MHKHYGAWDEQGDVSFNSRAYLGSMCANHMVDSTQSANAWSEFGRASTCNLELNGNSWSSLLSRTSISGGPQVSQHSLPLPFHGTCVVCRARAPLTLALCRR